MLLFSQDISTSLLIFMGVTLPIALGQTPPNVNILLFYERPESLKAFDAAVEYIKNNPSFGFQVGEVYKALSNMTEGTKLIQSLCKDIDASYGMEEGKKPDIVLDFTRCKVPSEGVKLLTKIMTLPTISGSFGQEGDIRSWRDLTEEQKGYLIQIAPPADLVPQAVRSIVSQQNMKNAVLVFDNAYEMIYKNKTLLKNMKTKHLITKLERGMRRLQNQIDDLVQQDYSNFFIAASPTNISKVFFEASDPELKNRPLFGKKYAWYSMSMESGLPQCSACDGNVSVIHLSPKLRPGGNTAREFLKSKGIFKTERLMDLFYFDLTMNAVSTVAKMKKNGVWVSPPKRVCKEQEAGPNDYTLKLFDNLKSSDISKENIVGPFHFDMEKTVGKSHAMFEMTFRRLVFQPKQADPVTNVELGTWYTGFGEKELINWTEK